MDTWRLAQAKVTLAKALAAAAKPGTGFESEKVWKQKWGLHQDLQLKLFGPEDLIEATVQKGKLPASLMAWKCACDCYRTMLTLATDESDSFG